VSDPQIWTLIGVFAASTFGMIGLTSTLFLRVLRAEIGGLRGELGGQIGGLRGELKGDLAALEARMDARFEALDRDISAIARRVFPDEP